MTEPIRVTTADAIAQVTLCRPEVFNALDLETARALAGCLLGLATDVAIRAVVVGGEGKAFSAGGDLRWVRDHPRGPAGAFHELAAHVHQAVLEVRRMPKPVIAAIDGVAAGGGFSLALACDFRVMGKSAVLKQAYTSSGLCIDGGGTFSLPRLVGLARALEIAAFDRPISAEDALRWGLATRVVDDGRAASEALAMARELSGRSLHAFGWAKRLLTDSFETPLETQMERERDGLGACAAHPDGAEGLAAFVAKRRPVFVRS